jgi:hypothetical protein
MKRDAGGGTGGRSLAGLLNTFRTICIAPPAEIRQTFEKLKANRLAV